MCACSALPVVDSVKGEMLRGLCADLWNFRWAGGAEGRGKDDVARLPPGSTPASVGSSGPQFFLQ